jgi:hypothetical protein
LWTVGTISLYKFRNWWMKKQEEVVERWKEELKEIDKQLEKSKQ